MPLTGAQKTIRNIAYIAIAVIAVVGAIYKYWPSSKTEKKTAPAQSQTVTVTDSSKVEGGIRQVQQSAGKDGKNEYKEGDKIDNSTTAPVDRSIHETTVVVKTPSFKPRHFNEQDKKILDTITAVNVLVEEENRYDQDTKDSETDAYADQIIAYLTSHHQVTSAQRSQIMGPAPNANGRFYIRTGVIKIYRQRH